MSYLPLSKLSKSGRLFVAGSLAVVFVLASGGCKEAIENSGEDNAYLRTTQSNRQNANYDADLPLMPMTVGNWWEYQVQTVKQQAGGKPSTEEAYRERCVVVASATVNGQTGMRLSFTRAGKKPRAEVYASNRDGIFFLGATATQTVAMSSPLPLVRLPSAEGEYFTWDGLLDFGQNSAPGRSYSRLTAREPVRTPMGKFDAWRTDTEVETNIGGHAVQQIESRWFVPGYGVVRQESRTGSEVGGTELTTRLLTSCFRGAKTR